MNLQVDKILLTIAMAIGLLLVALALTGCENCKKIDEPTFMTVCKHGDTFEYAPDGQALSCAAPTVIEWDHVPLAVYVHYDGESTVFARDIDEAVALWNHAVPNMFTFTDNLEVADVEVVFDSVGETEFGAARHEFVEGRLHGIAYCRRCALVGQTYLVLAHELGHVLGLAHDPQRTSIMYDEQDPPIGSDGQFTGIRIQMVTDADRKALRARY